MKEVLVITYYWPPSGGAGVQRWLKFVKYLRDYGWEPIVYTPENPEAPVIDDSLAKDVPEGLKVIKRPIWEPYTFYKKFIGQKKESRINAGFLSESEKPKFSENLSVWIRGNLFIPDARKFWIKPSVKFLSSYLRENPVDAIVSTGPPHSMHLIALNLKKKLHIPWLADFRDPWTNIDFYDELKLTGFADKKHHKLERTVLSSADVVSVISNGMAKDFNSILQRKYEVITNGFDEEDFVGIRKIATEDKFTISHIGTLVKSRNPVYLWKALSALVKQDAKFSHSLKIKLIGSVDHAVTESIIENNLIEYVEKIDYVPHQEVVKLQRQSHLLLLLINKTPNANLILTGKFFEYMAAGRPVLCIGPQEGDAARIIRELDIGYTCEYDEITNMTTAIKKSFGLFLKGEVIQTDGNIHRFSRKHLSGEMASLFEEMTSG